MAEVLGSIYCRRCRRWVAASRTATPHVLHLLLAVITFGLWLLVWAVSAIDHAGTGMRCRGCGWLAPAPAGLRALRQVAMALLVGACLLVAGGILYTLAAATLR